MDCNTGDIVSYSHGIADLLYDGSVGTYWRAYKGGVYSPSQDRIYFVPSKMLVTPNGFPATNTLHYIDTSSTLVPVNARLTLPYAPPGSRNGNPHNQGVVRALDGNPAHFFSCHDLARPQRAPSARHDQRRPGRHAARPRLYRPRRALLRAERYRSLASKPSSPTSTSYVRLRL